MSQPHPLETEEPVVTSSPERSVLQPSIHLCLVQPVGQARALNTLDVALALRDEFQALGLTVSMGRQRLVPRALNFVIGVEHGWDADAALGYQCVLVNMAAEAPAPVPLRQLRRWPVLNAQPAAALWLRPSDGHQPPIWTWLPGPRPGAVQGAEGREIACLYLDDTSPRQAAVLQGIIQMGHTISRPAQRLAGPERAQVLERSQLVLRLLAHDDAPPDALSLALDLRLGVPILAEQANHPSRQLSGPLAEGVAWFEPTPQSLNAALSPQGRAQAQAALARWQAQPAQASAMSVVWQAVRDWWQAQPALSAPPVRRLRVIGPHQARWPGWWHWPSTGRITDTDADEDVDLSAPLPTTWTAKQGQLQVVDLGEWRPGRPDHAAALGAAVRLLGEQGTVVLRYRASGEGLLSEAGLRQALEPWLEALWHGGGVEHRLELVHLGWLDAQGLPLSEASPKADCARVVLRKAETDDQARQEARARRADFGLPSA